MVKTVFVIVLTLIVAFSVAFPVFAAAKTRSESITATLGGLSLTPTIGGYFFSESEQRDATQSYGLKIGYDNIVKSMTDSLGIEGTVNYFTTRSKADSKDATGYLFRLDAIYPIIFGSKWMPTLAVGGGGIVIDNVSVSEKNPLFNYGVGVKYFFDDYLAVRFDARHVLVYKNINTSNNFEVGVGVSYYFGKEGKKKTVQPATVELKKTEGSKN